MSTNPPQMKEAELKLFEYTVIFENAEEGGYTVHVPALHGLVTEGETYEEAKDGFGRHKGIFRDTF